MGAEPARSSWNVSFGRRLPTRYGAVPSLNGAISFEEIFARPARSAGGIIGPKIATTDPPLRALVIMAGPASKGIEISKAQNRATIDRNTAYSAAIFSSTTHSSQTRWRPRRLVRSPTGSY